MTAVGKNVELLSPSRDEITFYQYQIIKFAGIYNRTTFDFKSINSLMPEKPKDPDNDAVCVAYLHVVHEMDIYPPKPSMAARQFMTQAIKLRQADYNFKESMERLGNIDFLFTNQGARNTKGLKAETMKLQRQNDAIALQNDALMAQHEQASKQAEWTQWKMWANEKSDFKDFKNKMKISVQKQQESYPADFAEWEKLKEEEARQQNENFDVQRDLIRQWLDSENYKSMKTWYFLDIPIKLLTGFFGCLLLIPLSIYTLGLIWLPICSYRVKYWRWPFPQLISMIFGIKSYKQCQPHMTLTGTILPT